VFCVPVHRFFASARLSGRISFTSAFCRSGFLCIRARISDFSSACLWMQEASCDGERSGPPGSLPLPSQPSLPSRPSFSLQLYDRFVRNNEISDPSACYPVNHNNPMEIDVDDAVATPGIPPSADDAIVLPVSMSSSQGITTPCISTSSLKGKNSTKRELVDDSHPAILVKKPPLRNLPLPILLLYAIMLRAIHLRPSRFLGNLRLEHTGIKISPLLWC